MAKSMFKALMVGQRFEYNGREYAKVGDGQYNGFGLAVLYKRSGAAKRAEEFYGHDSPLEFTVPPGLQMVDHWVYREFEPTEEVQVNPIGLTAPPTE